MTKLKQVVSLFAASSLIILSSFVSLKGLSSKFNIFAQANPNMSVSFDSQSNNFQITVDPNPSDADVDWTLIYRKTNGTTNGLSGNGNGNPFVESNLFAGTCSDESCVKHDFTHFVAKTYISTQSWGKTQFYQKTEGNIQLLCEYGSTGTELSSYEDSWVSSTFSTPTCATSTPTLTNTQTPTLTPTTTPTATPTRPVCTPSVTRYRVTIEALCTINPNYRLWLFHNPNNYAVSGTWEILGTQQGASLMLSANEYYWLATLPENTNTIKFTPTHGNSLTVNGPLNLCPTSTPTQTPTVTPTVTPTATPTQTPTSSSNSSDNNNSSNPGNPGPPVCGDTRPGTISSLQVSSSTPNSLTLSWNAASDANYYALLFTRLSDGQTFGASNIGNVTQYKINGISGGSYKFEVFAVHGCMPGDKVSLTTGVTGSFLSTRPIGANGQVLGTKVTPTATPTRIDSNGQGSGAVSGASTCQTCRWIPALLIQIGSLLVLSYVAKKSKANNNSLKKYFALALVATIITYIIHLLINRPCLAHRLFFYYVPGFWICKFMAFIQLILVGIATAFWSTFKPEIKIRKK